MIPQQSFHAAKNRSAKLMAARGYESVQPVSDCYLSRHITVHLIGLKGDYEALCVKLRLAQATVNEAYVESHCRYDICQFRTLLALSPGGAFLRCEEWVVSPNGSIHCFDVQASTVTEVAAYAR